MPPFNALKRSGLEPALAVTTLKSERTTCDSKLGGLAEYHFIVFLPTVAL